jgi:hypothetical protein
MQQNQQSPHLSQTSTLSDVVAEAAPQAAAKRSWVSPKIDEVDYRETQGTIYREGGADDGYYS